MPSSDPPEPRPVVIVGPTAAGKSAAAMALARLWSGTEILAVDSMQVYRGMDIGTAKPTTADQAAVPHHLINLIDPHESMDIVDFAAAHTNARADIASRNGRPLLVGGTGLYIRAVIDNLTPPPRHPDVVAELEIEPDTTALYSRLAELDPVAASRVEPNNRRRVVRALEVCIGTGQPFSSFGPGMDQYQAIDAIQIGIDSSREILDRRIHRRYEAQMDAGFLDEVAALKRSERPWSRTAAQALGYKELDLHLDGQMDLDAAIDLAKQRTRRFARRQQRWFRRDPRITWFEHEGDPLDVVDAIVRHVAEQPLDTHDG